MKNFFKILAVVFGILFLISAGLQYNDPDSLVWIVIWGVAGVLSLAYAFNRVGASILLVGGIAALVGFFYTYPEKFEGFEIGQGNIKNVEEGREAFGLLIIAIILLVLAIQGMLKRKSKV